MDCKKAELYIDSLLINELDEKDNIDLIEHLETCHNCKTKWELNEDIKLNFKHFISSIKTPDSLKKNIRNKIINQEQKFIKLKPSLIAASIIFLLGLGLFFNETFSSVPPLDELHNNIKIKKGSYSTYEISNKTGIKINNSFLSNLKEKEYFVEGIGKVKKSFTKEANIVYLRNNKGERVSICFLPENYEMPKCHSINKNGTLFHCGNKGNCHYAYWKQHKKTIAVVANSFSSDEIIEMSVPLTEEI